MRLAVAEFTYPLGPLALLHHYFLLNLTLENTPEQ